MTAYYMEGINLQREITMMTLCTTDTIYAQLHFLHGLGTHQVKHVRKSYLENELTPCTYGNTNRVQHNALSYTDPCNLVKFIQNYVEQYAILLPGCIPTDKRDDYKLLPSSDSKKVR